MPNTQNAKSNRTKNTSEEKEQAKKSDTPDNGQGAKIIFIQIDGDKTRLDHENFTSK